MRSTVMKVNFAPVDLARSTAQVTALLDAFEASVAQSMCFGMNDPPPGRDGGRFTIGRMIADFRRRLN
jgi:hypothetical protein